MIFLFFEASHWQIRGASKVTSTARNPNLPGFEKNLDFGSMNLYLKKISIARLQLLTADGKGLKRSAEGKWDESQILTKKKLKLMEKKVRRRGIGYEGKEHVTRWS